MTANWQRALGEHREAQEIPAVTARLRAHGVTADIVQAVLSNPNLFLNAPEHDGPGWTHRYGGPVGAALIASELVHYLSNQKHTVEQLRLDLIADMASSSPERPGTVENPSLAHQLTWPGLRLVGSGTDTDEAPRRVTSDVASQRPVSAPDELDARQPGSGEPAQQSVDGCIEQVVDRDAVE